MLAVIRGILNTARKEWGWIDTVPAIRLLPEPKQRIRWLTPDECRPADRRIARTLDGNGAVFIGNRIAGNERSHAGMESG